MIINIYIQYNSVSTYPLGNEQLVGLNRVYVLTEFTLHRDTYTFTPLPELRLNPGPTTEFCCISYYPFVVVVIG